jgi:RNA polymerase sporulation-specific sigma factor
MIYVMNDYELIYLIRCNACEHALNFMYQKYQRFIWKHIHHLNVEQKEHDDFHQEGLLTLHKAIQTFNETYQKSFTKYFELILRRHFYGLIRCLPEYTLFETTDFVKEYTLLEEEVEYMTFESDIEREIHNRYVIERQPVKQIACETGLAPKQIYNAIYRIKEKYKIMI